MNETETLYDRTIRKLKNNKIVVVVLVAFAALLGLAQLQGVLSGIWTAFSPVKTQVQVNAYVERYDFMMGSIKSPKLFKSVQSDITHVQQVAENLAEELNSTIGSAQGRFDAKLQIDGLSLHATHSLHVAVLVFVSPMEQAGRVAHELGDVNSLDLPAIFADRQFTGLGGSSVDVEVSSAVGSFEREPLKIFKRPDGFSFEADVRVQEKALTFSPRNAKIILSKFEAKGEELERASVALDFALRAAVQKYPSLELSPLSLEALEKEKERIQKLGPGGAKSDLANQFNVDYVVTGTVGSPRSS